jgi:glucose/arabinose dehydrogenase
MPIRTFAAGLAMLIAAGAAVHAQTRAIEGNAGSRLSVEAIAEFDEPWAMAFLPDGRLLVTERRGNLLIVTQDGAKTEVAGAPKVSYGGQGGFGDVVLHPRFAENGFVYLSYAEPGAGGQSGAAVARAKLDPDKPRLSGLEIIWRQQPKANGKGHFGHRMAFGPDGLLYITSGDRQLMKPAQQMNNNLGKIIRLNDDGSVPEGNPFQDDGRLAKTFWTVGQRNPLGIAFDAQGRLWSHEMGPAGGDELNLIQPGRNYGWPVVSDGSHYNGTPIPDHSERPEFEAPKVSWSPVIAPAGLVIYSGDLFADWRGDALIGGLRAQGLVRVKLVDSGPMSETERFDFGARIREVEQAPDGSIWLLEDRAGGRLLKVVPAS